jgi:DNA-binding response OmpR family regulator
MVDRIPTRSTSATSIGWRLDFEMTRRALQGHRVVVIDDDSESFGRAFISLSRAGCEATLARRWAQVAPAVRQRRPTLIIFSTELTDADGLEILGRLRNDESTKAAIVVALASRESRKERRKLLALGCDGYIWKPTDRYLFATELVERTPRLLDVIASTRA